MPVDAFRLQNFMAFNDTGWVTLRRINLLLGRNSGGKTAIIRALRLMKQSLLDQSIQRALKFKVEGGVDIGSFQAALHKLTNPIVEADQIAFGLRGWINAQSLDDAQNSDKDIKWSILRKRLSDVAHTRATTLPFEVQLSYKSTGLVIVPERRGGIQADVPWVEKYQQEVDNADQGSERGDESANPT